MRRYVALLTAALGLLPAGCGIVGNASRNIINEPHYSLDAHVLRHRARSQGRQAWAEWGKCQKGTFSGHYRDGFVDGYADYLLRGGSGDPPPVPPDRYRHHHFANFQGYLAIEEYFAGFRAGAETAIASGRREATLVPAVGPFEPPTRQFAPVQWEPPVLQPPSPKAGKSPAPGPDILPPPRVLPNDGAAKPEPPPPPPMPAIPPVPKP